MTALAKICLVKPRASCFIWDIPGLSATIYLQGRNMATLTKGLGKSWHLIGNQSFRTTGSLTAAQEIINNLLTA